MTMTTIGVQVFAMADDAELLRYEAMAGYSGLQVVQPASFQQRAFSIVSDGGVERLSIPDIGPLVEVTVVFDGEPIIGPERFPESAPVASLRDRIKALRPGVFHHITLYQQCGSDGDQGSLVDTSATLAAFKTMGSFKTLASQGRLPLLSGAAAGIATASVGLTEEDDDDDDDDAMCVVFKALLSRRDVLESDRAVYLKRISPPLSPGSSTLQAFQTLPDEARGDHAVVVAAATFDWRVFEFADPCLRAHKDTLLAVVAAADQSSSSSNVDSWGALKFAHTSLKSDRDLVRGLLTNGFGALVLASSELKGDKELMLFAVSRYWKALSQAGDELKSDRDVVMAAIACDWRALGLADETFRRDRDAVLLACGKSWRALELADEALRSDKEVVLAAVDQNWRGLKLASEELRADMDVVSKAVHQDQQALNYAASSIKQTFRRG